MEPTNAELTDVEPTNAELTVHATLDDVEDSVGGGSGAESTALPRWLVVEDCGDRARPRIRTAEGIPVVCPVRDGVHALYPDGAVWRNSAGTNKARKSVPGKRVSGKRVSGKGRSGESGTMGA